MKNISSEFEFVRPKTLVFVVKETRKRFTIFRITKIFQKNLSNSNFFSIKLRIDQLIGPVLWINFNNHRVGLCLCHHNPDRSIQFTYVQDV